MKKVNKEESLPRHEAIVALKQIAIDRNDPYLADQIETWIQTYVLQVYNEHKTDSAMISFMKDPVDYLDHVKKKSMIELGAGAANMASETFEVEGSDIYHVIRFRMLALRPNRREQE